MNWLDQSVPAGDVYLLCRPPYTFAVFADASIFKACGRAMHLNGKLFERTGVRYAPNRDRGSKALRLAAASREPDTVGQS